MDIRLQFNEIHPRFTSNSRGIQKKFVPPEFKVISPWPSRALTPLRFLRHLEDRKIIIASHSHCYPSSWVARGILIAAPAPFPFGTAFRPPFPGLYVRPTPRRLE